MRQPTPALALLVLTSLPVLAAPPPPAAIPAIPYTSAVLKNGLTLLVHEDHKAPIVAVNLWYHVGSKNERPGRTGFAHLFEHLMFNGSENYNDDYFKAVEPLGATDLNGTTNEDRTNYFQNVPVSALDRLLFLESDRMGHLLGAIDQARLDEQRGVVQNEKRQGENEPYGKVDTLIPEVTYPRNHPYSWPVIGSMADLNAASLEDVKEWFRTYYGPSNAVLVVAGDVKAADVRQRVEKYFGDIPPGPPIAKVESWVAKMTGERRQVLQDRVPQARVTKVWNVAPYGSPDAAYLQIATSILGSGRSSRLYKRLVYKDRLATDATALLDEREISSQFHLRATVLPGVHAAPDGAAEIASAKSPATNLVAVETALDQELAAFLKDGPTAEELERAKTQIRAGFVRGIERIGGFGGKSDVLARGQVFLSDPEAYQKTLRTVLAASADDVRGAAQRWLSDGVYVLDVVPFPDYAPAAAALDRKTLPPAGTPPDAPLPPIEKATLANGLKVLLARRTAVPVVRLSLLLDAGYAADPPAKPGLATMTMSMLLEGTASRDALQLADQIAGLGASFQAGADLDVCSASLSALKDKLAPSLDVYSDAVLNPAFPEKELERVRRQTLARIGQEQVEPVTAGLRVIPGLLYGTGHAYAQPLTGSGTEASIKGMTRADLAAFHRTWFKPNHATMLVVGDITLAEAVPALEKAFAPWKPGDTPKKNVAPVAARGKDEVYLIDRPGAEQSVIFVAQLLPPTNNPDEAPFQVFNDAFGGAFTSRINMNLREDKHWAYGAGTYVQEARGQRLYLLYAPVQTDKTKESLEELRKEMAGVVGSRPITAKEVKEAQDRLTLTLAGRWETASAVGSSVADIVTYGLPEDYYATYAARIRGVQPELAARTSRKLLTPGKQVWVVIGDRAKIEAGVRSLGLGEPRLLAAEGSAAK